MENGMGSEMPEQPQEMPKTVSYGRRGADPRVIVGAAVAVLLVLAFLFFFSWAALVRLPVSYLPRTLSTDIFPARCF